MNTVEKAKIAAAGAVLILGSQQVAYAQYDGSNEDVYQCVEAYGCYPGDGSAPPAEECYWQICADGNFCDYFGNIQLFSPPWWQPAFDCTTDPLGRGDLADAATCVNNENAFFISMCGA